MQLRACSGTTQKSPITKRSKTALERALERTSFNVLERLMREPYSGDTVPFCPEKLDLKEIVLLEMPDGPLIPLRCDDKEHHAQ